MRFAIPFALFADRFHAVCTKNGTQGGSLYADLFHVEIQLVAIARLDHVSDDVLPALLDRFSSTDRTAEAARKGSQPLY
jgi:hypothetical protein